MKKSLVIALIMVLAMAGIASAEVKFGGEMTVEYAIDTDKEGPAGKGYVDAPLLLKATAEEEGVWNVDAELKVNGVKADEDDERAVKLGKWSMNLTDELFVADLWGGGLEKTEVKTPLEFVKAGKKGEADKAKLRVTSDIAGYVDLTLDYQPDEVVIFAEKALDDVTVGGAVKKDLTDEPWRVAGHVGYTYGDLTLTGEVGMDTKEEEDNIFAGGKVAYELNEKITLNGKATYSAANLDDEWLAEAGAVYTEDLFKVGGTLTLADDLDEKESKVTYKVAADVTYRSNEDVAFDDLFDDYDTLTGYAAYAEGAYTTAAKWEDDNEPLMEATLKGAGLVVPDMVWVYGEFAYASDKDADIEQDFEFIDGQEPESVADEVTLLVQDYFKVKAEGTVKPVDKVKVIPAVSYSKWNELTGDKNAKDLSKMDLSTAVTYELSASSEVGVSYTSTQYKFTESQEDDDEPKDNFAKVWFTTKF